MFSLKMYVVEHYNAIVVEWTWQRRSLKIRVVEHFRVYMFSLQIHVVEC